MKILEKSENLGLLMYQVKDYLYNDVFVVCYGLYFKQHTDKAVAYKHWLGCIKHALQCEGYSD